MSYIKGSRTNLGSESASISTTVAGEGEFRTAYHGTYRGGQRNQQEAICKKFKPKYARITLHGSQLRPSPNFSLPSLQLRASNVTRLF